LPVAPARLPERLPIEWHRKAIPFDRMKLLDLLKRAGNFIG
jgi:hypothetical protein